MHPEALNVAAFAACFGSFFWGIHRFFTRHGGMPQGMQLTQRIGLTMAVWQLLVLVAPAPVEQGARWLALALYLLALALFWWTVASTRRSPLTLAFSDDAPESLVHSGPYRYVRHPFYLSYALAWVAVLPATGAAELVVSVIVMWLCYWQAATAEEEKFSRSPLARAYAAYRRDTGMFLPRIHRRQ